MDEIIRTFGKSGTEFSNAVLKARRDRSVSTVCHPQVFKDSLFMERETQMKSLDDLIFNAKNAKDKRSLIVAVASSGMGKSAFVDEYCRKRLLRISEEHDIDDGLRNNVYPIAITFNTKMFGGSLKDDAVDLAARLLMSYFLSNPSIELLEHIHKVLSKNAEFFESTNGVFRAAMQCIKEDLRTQSGVSKPKILIACDEVGKSKDEIEVVALLMSLIDKDDDVECFFTGLSLNPFLKETSSGRFIEYVPLPLLTFQTSLQLVQSFMGGSPSLLKVSSKLARLSGGHPRTIEVFEKVIKASDLSNKQLDATELQAVVDASFKQLPRFLSEEDIMLLLRPRTLLTDIKRNVDLIEALGDGRIYTTIFSPKKNFVELFTSPMLLRSSLLDFEKEGNANVLIKSVNEMLKLAGLRDLDDFRADNKKQNGKTFENFFLQMEMLRRGFLLTQLSKDVVNPIASDHYPSVTYSQNCKVISFKLASDFDVVDVSCQSDFPSSNPADAAVLERVKALIDDGLAANQVIRPDKENQAAYDFFFILRGLTEGTRFVQLIEPTFSASNSDQFFIDRYVKKLKSSDSLAWNELGIDKKDIIHTFVSTGSTSHIDWKTVFDNAGYSDRRVLILDKKDLASFYGPMLNVLFSSCFSD